MSIINGEDHRFLQCRLRGIDYLHEMDFDLRKKAQSSIQNVTKN